MVKKLRKVTTRDQRVARLTGVPVKNLKRVRKEQMKLFKKEDFTDL